MARLTDQPAGESVRTRVNTPEWRDSDSIEDTASANDSSVIRATRCWHTNPQELKEALVAGADVNAVDKFGYTPLMLAVKSKQAPLIDLLLEVDGIDLNIQTTRGFSALMIAAWKGDNDTIDKLVAKGAKLELKDGGKRNAWGIAHDWHHESTLECLGRHGMTYTSHGGTSVAFPPAPKWRPNEKWD